MSYMSTSQQHIDPYNQITYTIIFDEYTNMLTCTIIYKCKTQICTLYNKIGTLTRCIGCGHYRKMVKLYKPNPPIFSIM
jgi:hypothetical protein